jgi:hypothetical protein
MIKQLHSPGEMDGDVFNYSTSWLDTTSIFATKQEKEFIQSKLLHEMAQFN